MTPITLPELPVAQEALTESGDSDDAELAQEDPLEGLEFTEEAEEPQEPEAAGTEEPLMDLNAAVEQIPEALRKEMADLLRAEFREVIRWKPEKK